MGVAPAAVPPRIAVGPTDGLNVLLKVAGVLLRPPPQLHINPPNTELSDENSTVCMSKEDNMDEKFLERANDIMENAMKTANELLHEKPRVAELILRQLLKCDPEHLGALELLGICKQHLGCYEESIEILQTVLELDPKSTDAWNNLGLAYNAVGKYDKAIECAQKAIEISPRHYFYGNLGLHYISKGDYARAEKAVLDGIAIQATPQLLGNLGCFYGEVGDTERARQAFTEALKLDPDYPVSHVELAFTYFLDGDWENGFKEYEHRFQMYHQLSYYLKCYDQTKRWDGQASLKDKRILVYCEQGLGDAVQFVRYVKKLKELGAYTIVHCHEALELMLERVDWIDEILVRDITRSKVDPLPDYDYQCSAISLPYLLKDFNVCGKPYLTPATTKFREHIQKDYSQTFNIGIVWAGSPSHPNDRHRSIPLKHFKLLSDMPEIKLFSLQLDTRPHKYDLLHREPGKDAIYRTSFDSAATSCVDYTEGAEDVALVNLSFMVQSVEDTATILAGLDLLISCDTAPVHIAGAIGTPCWLLLPFSPDWRWGKSGDSTVWYDSVRVFRQTRKGDWTSVFHKLKQKLGEMHAFILQNK